MPVAAAEVHSRREHLGQGREAIVGRIVLILELAIDPPIGRQGQCGMGMGDRRGWQDRCDRAAPDDNTQDNPGGAPQDAR